MFNLVTEFLSESGNRVQKYRSDETRLTAIFIDIEGPIVNGFFALSTEVHDDDGCPHTLEHLVFLGSENYPYKGVLDRLANRSLARGTNAWTDTDNVVFTISTAGSEGFLNVLPVYLDHILYCTLTDSGFHTEVHHVNERGENAGVVYSEMQGRQNTGSDLLHLKMLRLAYPGECGYKSETGGLMENLRELTVEKIRDFHRDYFRPDNLCLIITGKISPEKVFEALHTLEEKIKAKGPLPKMERPWFTRPIPPLVSSVEEVIEFPDEDESIGEVIMAWRGPDFNDFLEKKATEVLLEYLSNSSVSVLSQHLVEIEEPYCAEISHSSINNLQSLNYLNFENADATKLQEIPQKFFEIVRAHAADGFDMERMATVIESMRQQAISSTESNPHNQFALSTLGHFLYGDHEGKVLPECLKDLEHFEKLSAYSAEQWKSVLFQYFIDCPCVSVLGKPSAAMAAKLAEDEKKRIEEQRALLGEERLLALRRKLEEATEQNERPIPPDVIESVPIPGVATISFIPVLSSTGERNTLTEHVFGASGKNPTNLSVLHFDDIKSAFVEIQVFFDTEALTPEQRCFIPLYLDSIFELPVERDGEIVPYEEIVKELDKKTIQRECGVGMSNSNFSVGDFSQLISIKTKCAKEKYFEVVKLMGELLWKSVFSPERLKVSVAKMLNGIPQEKREGMKMARTALKALCYDRTKSNHLPCSVFKQAVFLEEIQGKLESSPEFVVKDMLAFREAICFTENIIANVAGSILSLPNPAQPWFEHFEPHKKNIQKASPFKLSNELHSEVGKNPSNQGFVLNLPTIESSFSIHLARAPTSYLDEDIPALLVLGEYLSTMEGPFWKQIRGQGLAYGCNLNQSADSGFVTFSTYRAPDAFKAYSRAKSIVEEYSSGKIQFDPTDLEGAKSSVIFAVISNEETVFDAAFQSFVSHIFQKTGGNFNKRLLQQLKSVTLSDVERVLHNYVKHIFNPETSVTVVATGPAKYQEIVSSFSDSGYKLVSVDSIDDILSFL